MTLLQCELTMAEERAAIWERIATSEAAEIQRLELAVEELEYLVSCLRS